MPNKNPVRFEQLTRTPRSAFTSLLQLPNVGPATASYLKRVGVSHPVQLVGSDPYVLYDKLCRVAGAQYDPCLLDQFISAVRFMNGEAARPWWEYTAQRKQRVAELVGQEGE